MVVDEIRIIIIISYLLNLVNSIVRQIKKILQKMTYSKAQKIQDEIFYNMPAEKKIRLASQFFELAVKLKNAKTIEKTKIKNGARRTNNKNS